MKSPETHEPNKIEKGGAFYRTVEEIKQKDLNVFKKLVESKIPFSEDDTILRSPS